MGAFLSASGGHGHSSHPEHCARFNRVNRSDSPPSPCRMCRLNVELGAAAYRCSEPGCAVVLHDACYRLPTTLKRHFGHPQHHLTLGAGTRAASHAAASRAVSCSLCAQPLSTPTVAYSCADDGCAVDFTAHPRCCHLPKNMSTRPELHEHTRLVLRPPGGKGGGGSSAVGQPQRKCLNCRKTTKPAGGAGRKAPWSYQCLKCTDVEYCLACVLGDDDRIVRCCCLPCCDVDPAAVRCVGHLVGVFFCAFLSGMGCPGSFPTQLHPAPPRQRANVTVEI